MENYGIQIRFDSIQMETINYCKVWHAIVVSYFVPQVNDFFTLNSVTLYRNQVLEYMHSLDQCQIGCLII